MEVSIPSKTEKRDSDEGLSHKIYDQQYTIQAKIRSHTIYDDFLGKISNFAINKPNRLEPKDRKANCY